MKLKEFFKPSISKIILFILLMGVLNYIIISSTIVFDARILVGFPLGFWPVGSFMVWLANTQILPIVEFSWLNFIIDMIFWYIISCGIIELFKKIKPYLQN